MVSNQWTVAGRNILQVGNAIPFTVLYNVQYSTVQNIYPNIYNAELAQPIYLNTYLAYLVILVVV